MSGFPVDTFTISVGLVILTFGRKLFWFFVGGAGFIFGMRIASHAAHGQPEWMLFLIALLFGVFGAIFAIFLQRFALIVSGFLAGSYFLLNLVSMGGLQIGPMLWLLCLAGGIIGALAAYHFFDWALIILSASTGAAMITENLGPGPPFSIVLPVVLFIAGVAVQAGLMQRDRSRSSAQKTMGA
jgi:uncharacterized membrane protein YsdA (DUF1294 family)